MRAGDRPTLDISALQGAHFTEIRKNPWSLSNKPQIPTIQPVRRVLTIDGRRAVSGTYTGEDKTDAGSSQAGPQRRFH